MSYTSWINWKISPDSTTSRGLDSIFLPVLPIKRKWGWKICRETLLVVVTAIILPAIVTIKVYALLHLVAEPEYIQGYRVPDLHVKVQNINNITLRIFTCSNVLVLRAPPDLLPLAGLFQRIIGWLIEWGQCGHNSICSEPIPFSTYVELVPFWFFQLILNRV